jgi:nucleoporin GLE1
MSRVIKVKGNIFIENKKIAIDIIQEYRNGIYFENNIFRFEKYDAYDQISKAKKNNDIRDIETEYLRRYDIYKMELELKETKRKEQEKQRLLKLAEEARIEEEKRLKKEEKIRLKKIEEEQKRIEEEKRVLREEKAELIMANAKKQGYKLKKEIRENNTIKLVLQKRTY